MASITSEAFTVSRFLTIPIILSLLVKALRPIFSHISFVYNHLASTRLDFYTMDTALTFLTAIRPSEWSQLVYVVLGAGAIANDAAPQSFRDQLMCYGARQASPVKPTDAKNSSPSAPSSLPPAQSDQVTGKLAVFHTILTYTGLLIQVPHSWFMHFYMVLTAANLFWIFQYTTGGSVMRAVAQWELQPSILYPHSRSEPPVVPLEQIIAAMGMVTFQGIRRLAECLFVQKSSPNSFMLVMHWVLTFVFYTCISVSVWIEGASTILAPSLSNDPAALLRIAIVVPIFLVSSFGQLHSHKHLASLKKYTLPTAGLFKYFVCPHYFCESINYLCFALIAAPSGNMFNKTMLCALFFTVANLGVTARSTKPWYEGKFGKESVAGRWNMIPFVF